MSALPPDYDCDPGRWRSWQAPQDVHDIVAPELRGPVLDVGCGDGRLASLLDGRVRWTGVDSSPTQLAANPYRPVALADMRTLPFPAATFAEITHLWCLYHVDDPAAAVAEAAQVLVPGGRYFACTAARTSDPELLPDGYPPSSFRRRGSGRGRRHGVDRVETQWWDERFYALNTGEEVRGYCRHNQVPATRAEDVTVPLWLTKRGVLVRATKNGRN